MLFQNINYELEFRGVITYKLNNANFHQYIKQQV